MTAIFIILHFYYYIKNSQSEFKFLLKLAIYTYKIINRKICAALDRLKK